MTTCVNASLSKLRQAKSAGSVSADAALQDAVKRRRVLKNCPPHPSADVTATTAAVAVTPSAASTSSKAAAKPKSKDNTKATDDKDTDK